MEESASFETRAVLAPRRARRSRLALVLPALALVGTAWPGLSGERSGPSTAALPAPSAVIAPSLIAKGPPPAVASEVPDSERPQRPSEALGLEVRRLADLHPEALGRDEIVVIGGWFLATAVNDCPPVLIIRRPGELPEVHSGDERLTYCDRSGLLYDSEPDLTDRLPMNNLEDNRSKNAGLPALLATILPGVRTPTDLGVDGHATEVVVIGRFVPSGQGCDVVPGCLRELVIDHVAWSPTWQAGIRFGPG